MSNRHNIVKKVLHYDIMFLVAGGIGVDVLPTGISYAAYDICTCMHMYVYVYH